MLHTFLFKKSFKRSNSCQIRICHPNFPYLNFKPRTFHFTFLYAFAYKTHINTVYQLRDSTARWVRPSNALPRFQRTASSTQTEYNACQVKTLGHSKCHYGAYVYAHCKNWEKAQTLKKCNRGIGI